MPYRSRARRIPPSVLARALHGPCAFPRCICGTKLAFWNAEYDRIVTDREPAGWSRRQCKDALLSIACMLHCLSAHCPDRKVRAQATVQLLNPIYLEAFADD